MVSHAHHIRNAVRDFQSKNEKYIQEEKQKDLWIKTQNTKQSYDHKHAALSTIQA